MNKNITVIGVEIDSERSYGIEDVALLTGYTTGHIRNLEREKKIRHAQRDIKGWRVWQGSEVASIVDYCKAHHQVGSQNLISNRSRKKK